MRAWACPESGVDNHELLAWGPEVLALVVVLRFGYRCRYMLVDRG